MQTKRKNYVFESHSFTNYMEVSRITPRIAHTAQLRGLECSSTSNHFRVSHRHLRLTGHKSNSISDHSKRVRPQEAGGNRHLCPSLCCWSGERPHVRSRQYRTRRYHDGIRSMGDASRSPHVWYLLWSFCRMPL
ncbi:hypothetical protein XU18_0931 [Perkinsela sp. CCAP 1560/4]|nr:hypothetical protein XU18_0931 [Perkinsela sp. CCAP 1560/4]|eukprot:KNH08570.1 hypothetical protein XU18_0931 [Perkinsela sp. CCAP 1560/4]